MQQLERLPSPLYLLEASQRDHALMPVCAVQLPDLAVGLMLGEEEGPGPAGSNVRPAQQGTPGKARPQVMTCGQFLAFSFPFVIF